MKTRRRFTNRLKELRANFECGGCNVYFDTAYLLHDHMRDHVEGGSYYYDNAIQTAFPVYSKTEAATQTCLSDSEDINVNKFTELVQNIKNEESSDTDNCDDFANFNDVINSENNELGKTVMENAIENPDSNDRVPISVTERQKAGSKGILANSEEKSVNQANKQIRRKSGRLLKRADANINHCSKLFKSSMKQSLPHFQDVKVSLRRIDDIAKTEQNRVAKASKEYSVKDFHTSDDGLTLRSCIISKEIKEKKFLMRNKKRLLHKRYSAKNESENTKKDPDYNPGGTSTGQKFDVDYNTDNADDDNDDPYWKKAKLECKDMKCEHCNKFIEDEFSKANLLALHNIPFRQENDHIFIKANKTLHKTDELSIKLSTRKKIIPHSNEKMKCEECGKILSSEYMRKHMVKYHNAMRKSKGRPRNDKYFTCEICNKVLRTRCRKKHERIHMKSPIKSEPEETNAVCEICGQMCLNEKSLSNHMQVHSIKNLTCKHCDHVSSSVHERERHKKTHKFVHRCETCGVKIASKKGLLCHIRSLHQKVKRCVCDVCGRQFYAIYNMERHRATHFAPGFECGYCGRKFADPAALKRHVMTHTGDVKYTCPICNHGFIQSTPYWMHMQKRHSISREEAMAIHRKSKSSV